MVKEFAEKWRTGLPPATSWQVKNNTTNTVQLTHRYLDE